MGKRRRKRFSPNSLVENGNKIIQEWRDDNSYNIDRVFNNQFMNQTKSNEKNGSLNKVILGYLIYIILAHVVYTNKHYINFNLNKQTCLQQNFVLYKLWDRPNFREAALACYSMLRGFMNAMDAESPECSKRFICEVVKIFLNKYLYNS